MGTGSLIGVKLPGRAVDHQPLALRSKKKYSYTSASPLELYGLFWDEFYLNLPFCLIFTRNSGKNF
jgi:hypothetical protein